MVSSAGNNWFSIFPKLIKGQEDGNKNQFLPADHGINDILLSPDGIWEVIWRSLDSLPKETRATNHNFPNQERHQGITAALQTLMLEKWRQAVSVFVFGLSPAAVILFFLDVFRLRFAPDIRKR